ncbi:MAG: efflux RND transporter periplasmic adaptor subunit [Labilithrix sp.]|nr:efflux RND transporter periplasmic adaptor subunit [Labilithrix sp.]
MSGPDITREGAPARLDTVGRRARALPLGLLLLSMNGCGGHGEGHDRPGTASDPPLQLATTTTVASPTSGVVELSGVLEPERRVALASRIHARVRALSAEEGRRVRVDETLVQLDVRDLQARRAQLLASRTAAAAQADWSEGELKRSRALTASGALPGVQLDEVRRGRDVAQASLSGVNAQLLELDVNVADATIRAPFAGVIVRRTAELGQLAAPGQPLLVLEDDATLRVSMAVSAAEAAALTVGQRVPLRMDGPLSGDGTITAIVSSGDPGTPGLRMIVKFDNSAHTWRAGAVAHVALPLARTKAATVEVPAGAVRYRGSLPGVWVVRDDRLVFAWVRIARTTDTTTQLSSGVGLGERVVRDGGDPSLRDGLRVEATR